ncbi:MAG: hypothetical protein GC206_00035 [Alphaproteobacteria bacterium]|nr:hypothetical protein [Alphaproteobacteria bacterium]
MLARRRRHGPFAAALLALALAACSAPAEKLSARLGCPPALGVDRLLAQPQSRIVLLDSGPGDRAAAIGAALAIACHAAGRGERVMIGALGDGAETLDGPVRGLLRRGAQIDMFRLQPPAAEAAARLSAEERDRTNGDARADAAAEAISARADAADRFIIVVDAPDAAVAPVGLAGHTWRPLGARLGAREATALRAESWGRDGMRIMLTGFEDIPERGAALRYSGFVQVGPTSQQSPPASAADARTR